jgi:hypothetical protein
MSTLQGRDDLGVRNEPHSMPGARCHVEHGRLWRTATPEERVELSVLERVGCCGGRETVAPNPVNRVDPGRLEHFDGDAFRAAPWRTDRHDPATKIRDGRNPGSGERHDVHEVDIQRREGADRHSPHAGERSNATKRLVERGSQYHGEIGPASRDQLQVVC